jgi:hypothetical protein
MLRASQGGRVCCAGQGHRRLAAREMNHAAAGFVVQRWKPRQWLPVAAAGHPIASKTASGSR